jgi:iron complex transport system ATP-binding protein
VTSVHLEGVSVERGGVDVVRSLTLSIEAGSWCVIVGPNGAGKSSLLGAIAGTIRHRGVLLIDDVDVAKLSLRDRARKIAVVPQRPVLPEGISVNDYVMLGRTAHLSSFGREGKADRQMVTDTLERLDLGWLATRDVTKLSGGEMQRALIARALVQHTKVLLLDEPTTALDLQHQQQALELIDTLRREDDLTVVSALHDLTMAAQYGDRIALLTCGSLMAYGPPAEVLTQDRVQSTYGSDIIVRDDPDVGIVVIPRRR